jgi:hypothetical protein
MEKSFETEVITRLTKIETKLDDYKQVKDDSIKALQLSEANDCSIKEIKDNTKWLWRTLFVSILGIVTSIILMFIKISR